MAIISCLATLENGVLLLIFYKYSALITMSNKILISMIVADFLTGFSVGPLYAAQLLHNDFVYNCSAQHARIFLATVFVGASVGSVGFISADRAHHLIKLQNYNMKNTTFYSVLLLCWTVPIVIPVIGFFTSDKIYSMLIFLVGILVILIVIISYAALVWALQMHRDNACSENLDEEYVSNQTSAAKTAILIVTCYTLMLLPLFIEKIMYASKFEWGREEERAIFINISVLLCIANSSVNPYIYCIRIPSIRKHLVKLVSRHAPENPGSVGRRNTQSSAYL